MLYGSLCLHSLIIFWMTLLEMGPRVKGTKKICNNLSKIVTSLNLKYTSHSPFHIGALGLAS